MKYANKLKIMGGTLRRLQQLVSCAFGRHDFTKVGHYYSDKYIVQCFMCEACKKTETQFEHVNLKAHS